MKKLTAIALSLVLVFALAGCSVLGGLGKEKSRSKTYQLYEDYFTDGSYYIELTDTSINLPMTMAVDGENIYISTSSDGYSVIIIKNADGAYMLMPDYMMYYDLAGQDTSSYTQSTDFSDGQPTEEVEKLMESGDMDFDGGSYYYESFPTGESSSIRYLYEGDTLVYTIIYDGEEPTTIQKFSVLKSDVEASLFTIPDGYSPVA